MAETKYGKYILSNAIRHPIPKNRSELPGVSAKAEFWPEISGVNCNFGVHTITEPYLLPDPPHKHDFDEYLFFIGGNILNFEEFDAEIEVAIGEEWERHIITSTSVIYLPSGLQHCPIHVKRVGKPFLFGHIMLSGKYASDKGGEDALFTHTEDDQPKAGKKK